MVVSVSLSFVTRLPEYARVLNMSDFNQGMPGPNQDRKGLLAIALDHAWRWYDFRYSQAAQLINFFTLGATVMAAAYVSAINAGHHGTATAIALLGSLLTATSYVIGTRLTKIAHLAHEPLKEIQDELADALGIDTLRLVERRESRHGALSHSGAIANIMFMVVTAVCLAAAGFAWFGP
jgi:hypothetical protein